MKRYWTLFLLLTGCAGMERDCSSMGASSFGADWVITQMDTRGRPFRCWALRNTSVTNEPQSDGIYWQSPDGQLVHISGNYNRVQVVSGHWAAAYRELGLTRGSCEKIAGAQYTPGEDYTYPEGISPSP